MPFHGSAIVYVTDHTEVIRGDLVVTNAMSFYREDAEKNIPLKLTAFEHLNATTEESLKFAEGDIIKVHGPCAIENGVQCMVLSSVTIMPIPEADIPISPMFATVCGSASSGIVSTEHTCTIALSVDQYLGRNRQPNFQVQLVHSADDERLRKQTASVRHGSSLFAGGTVHQADDKLYLEVKDFSFLHRTSSSPERNRNISTSAEKRKNLPWVKSGTGTQYAPNVGDRPRGVSAVIAAMKNASSTLRINVQDDDTTDRLPGSQDNCQDQGNSPFDIGDSLIDLSKGQAGIGVSFPTTSSPGVEGVPGSSTRREQPVTPTEPSRKRRSTKTKEKQRDDSQAGSCPVTPVPKRSKRLADHAAEIITQNRGAKGDCDTEEGDDLYDNRVSNRARS